MPHKVRGNEITPMELKGQQQYIKCALMSALSAVVSFVPVLTFAGPTGASVQHGDIHITNPTAAQTVIQQNTHKGIINWQDFSVGSGERVDFHVPSASAKTLNRVTGYNVSDIQGQISSNGQLYIVNPNGVVFGAGSKVDAAGLLVTSSHMSNEDFLNNFMNLKPSAEGGSVVNNGEISIKDGGFALLVAPQVVNNGTIVARFGKVGLGAGSRASIDLYGDGLIEFSPSEESFSLVNNGVIEAGYVELSAADVDALLKSVVQVRGVIKADSVRIAGGDNSIVRLDGAVSAKQADGTGGRVDVLGDIVSLLENTDIDVSGELGGGQVHIGGDYQGKGTLKTATTTYMAAGAEIDASALRSGDGGKVILWADNTTYFGGRIAATGGSMSGDGGFVETSGKNTLAYRGLVDVTAANGDMGDLLLDPENITITSDPFTPTDGTGTVFWYDPSNAGTVTLDGSGNVQQMNDQATAVGGANNATQGSGTRRPDQAEVNGRDALDLDGVNDTLDVANNGSINTSSYPDRVITGAFRTSGDVSTRQYVYEQGGGTNGYGVYIEGGVLYVAGWRNSGSSWNNYGSVPVSANTTYVVALNQDASANVMDVWVNGAKVATFNNVSSGQNAHSGGIQIGSSDNSRLASGADPGTGAYFSGQIGELIEYNTAMTDTEIKETQQYLALQWGATLDAPGEDYTISLEVLEAQLPGANITLQAEDNITIDDIADNSLDLAMDSTGSFTLIADNDGDGTGTISMDASDAIVTQGGAIGMSGAIINVGNITSNGGDVTLTATQDLTANTVSAGTGSITLSADSDNNTAGSVLIASNLTADAITLNGGTDNDDTLNLSGTISSGAGGLAINNFADADLDGTINTNGLAFNSALDWTLSGTSAVQTGGADITFSGSVNGAEDFTLNAGAGSVILGDIGSGTRLNSITLNSADSTILGGLYTTDALNFTHDVTLAGTIDSLDTLTFANPITLTGASDVSGVNGVTFNGTVNGAQTLGLTSTAGDIAFNADVGALTDLGVITVNDVGNLAFAGTVDSAGFSQLAGRGLTNLGSTFNASGNVNVVGTDLQGDILSANNVNFNMAGSVTGQLFANNYTLQADSVNQTGEVGGAGGLDALANINFTQFGAGPHTFNGYPLPYEVTINKTALGFVTVQMNSAGLARPALAPTLLDILPDFALVQSAGRSRVSYLSPVGGVHGRLVQNVDNSLIVNPYLLDFRTVDVARGTEVFYNPYPYLEKSVWQWLSYRQ